MWFIQLSHMGTKLVFKSKLAGALSLWEADTSANHEEEDVKYLKASQGCLYYGEGKKGRVLFKFFHNLDMEKVYNRGPWTFEGFNQVLCWLRFPSTTFPIGSRFITFPLGTRTKQLEKNLETMVGFYVNQSDDRC